MEFFKQNPNSVFFIVGAFVALIILRQFLKSRKQYDYEDESEEGEFDAFGKTQIGSGKAVYFNFSGHAWDAYEVFGLSTDCTDDELEEAYMGALKEVEEGSREFVHLAYQAIQEKKH